MAQMKALCWKMNVPDPRRIEFVATCMMGTDFLEEERDRTLAYLYSPRATATGLLALLKGARAWTAHCSELRKQRAKTWRALPPRATTHGVRNFARVWKNHPYAPDSALNRELNRRFGNEAF